MKTLLLICSLLIAVAGFSQNPVPNSGFENWTNNEPDNWLTLNIPGVAVSCQQTNISQSGSSALKGIVVPMAGGFLWPPYVVSTNQAGDPFPVDQSYSNLSFYYQLDLKGNAEFFEATVAIADGSDNGIAGGNAEFFSNANTGVFTLANVPITYISGNPAGAYIAFAIYDTLDGAGVEGGSYYIVDEVSLNFFSNIEEVSSSVTINLPYPNPASSQINIPFVLKDQSQVSMKIYDVLGRKVSDTDYGTLQAGSYKEVMNVSSWMPGIYYCEISTDYGFNKMQFLVTGE